MAALAAAGRGAQCSSGLEGVCIAGRGKLALGRGSLKGDLQMDWKAGAQGAHPGRVGTVP